MDNNAKTIQFVFDIQFRYRLHFHTVEANLDAAAEIALEESAVRSNGCAD